MIVAAVFSPAFANLFLMLLAPGGSIWKLKVDCLEEQLIANADRG